MDEAQEQNAGQDQGQEQNPGREQNRDLELGLEAGLDQVSIDLTDAVSKAVDYAFKEAQEYLNSGIGIAPFTVTVVDDAFEVDDHSANAEDEVYESVKMLLAQTMPEGYALCYDGFAETDDGRRDAIVVETANRGDVTAYALVMMYSCENGRYIFDGSYGYAGLRPQLYPAGTRPIVSGMSALDDKDRAQMREERLAAHEELMSVAGDGAGAAGSAGAAEDAGATSSSAVAGSGSAGTGVAPADGEAAQGASTANASVESGL